MKKMMNSVSAIALLAVFEAAKPGWKLDENGAVVLRDGNPVYVQSDGTESALDGNTVARLNNEAKSHRERAEKAEGALKAFEGIDPAAAKKAIETVGKIDAKALIDAGEVDRVKDQIKGEYDKTLAEKDGALASAQAKINQMTLDYAFAGSDFVRERVAIPGDMFRAGIASHFKVEDGVIKAFDKAGNPVMSKKRLGEMADFNEALELIVDGRTDKDALLKPISAGGSGSQGGGGNGGKGRIMRRSEFEKLSPAEQSKTATSGEVTVVD